MRTSYQDAKPKKRCSRDARVTRDAVLLAEVGLNGAVDLGDLNVLLLERSGGLLVVGGEAAVKRAGKTELERW